MKKFLLLGIFFSISFHCYADFNQGVAAYQQQDYAAALNIWQKMAKQKPSKQLSSNEIREAQYSLALLYWQGQGVKQSYTQAEHWLLLAAKKGHSEAQSKLGNLYLLGLTGVVNTSAAQTWFEKSAQQGNVNGQYNLGVLYLDGVGVAKDQTLAKKWLSAAAAQGDEEAKKLLQETSTASDSVTTVKELEPQTTTADSANTLNVFSSSATVPTDAMASNNSNAISATYYAIQLFASPRQEEAVKFFETWQSQLSPLVNSDKLKHGQPLFIVVYGNYSSTAVAKQAINDLPAELKKHQPWVVKMQGNHLLP